MIVFNNCGQKGFATPSGTGNSDSPLLAAPEISYTTDVPTMTTQNSLSVSFVILNNSQDAVKSITCELVGTGTRVVHDCSSLSVTFSDIADSDYTLTIYLNSTVVGPEAAIGDLGISKKVFRKDSTPPVISVSSAPALTTSSLTAKFDFIVTDNLSGVKSIECSLDSAAFSTCVSGAAFSVGIGSHNYRIRATDTAGNTSAETPYDWTVTSTPVGNINLTSSLTSPTKLTSITFNFSSSVSDSTYECSLDSATFTVCISPTTLSSTEGTHTYSVRGKDSSGVLSSPATLTWTIDLTAPTLPVILSSLVSPSKINDVSYIFSSTDLNGIASYQCSQDDITYSVCTSPKTLTLADGLNSFYVKAQDLAGNMSLPSKLDLDIDTALPVVTITSTQSTTSLTGQIFFTATDTGSGVNKVQCSLDEAPFSLCASPLSYTVANGTHTLQIQASDLAGNISTMASTTWTVAAPELPPPEPKEATLTGEFKFEPESWDGTSFNGLNNKIAQEGKISLSPLSRDGGSGSGRFQVGRPQLPAESCFKYRAEVDPMGSLNKNYVWDDGKSHWIGVSINPTDMRGAAFTFFQIHAPNEGGAPCDYAGNAISINPIYVGGQLSYSLNLILNGGRSSGTGAGSGSEQVWSEPIIQGQWTDFVFNFTLSTKNSGYFKVWRNGVLIFSRSGLTNVNYIDSCGEPIVGSELRRHNGPHIGIYGPPCGLEPWRDEMATPDHFREALFDNLRMAVGGSDGYNLVDPSKGVESAR